MTMLKSSAAIFAAVLVMANAQSPSPFFSFGGGGGGPPSPSPYSGIGPSSSPYGRPGGAGAQFGGGSPFGGGRPGGFPGGKPPRQNAPSKLFSWLGSTMSKLSGSMPKIQYHSSKPQRPSSLGGLGGLSQSAQNTPQTYFSSGGPSSNSLILPQIPNSVFEGGSSPYGGSSSPITFGSLNSIDHPRVNYRSPGGPPSSGFGSRPGPPSASPFSSRPSFGSRPSIFSAFSSGRPSFSGGPGGPSYSTGGPGGPGGPSYSTGGPGGPGGPSYSIGGPSYSTGGPSPFSPSPYSSSNGPFGGSPSGSRSPYASPSQNIRNNLEVFPSQQVSYQSETLSQNEPGYNDALSGLQNLYASQSNSKPTFSGHSSFQQQTTSYSQPQQVRSGNNYGANFHSIEPVRVAPIYDVAQHFKSSSPDLNGAGSNQQRQQQQQSGSIHDTPFVSLVNQYAAHADAQTAGSDQMLSALQSAGSDLMSAASTNQPIPGVQILGNGNGNPMFEVMAGPNAPTYDGHPIDLNKLISMIEPGAQIDTIPNYGGDAQIGSGSEQQPTYAQAPSNLEMESDAAMASGILSGNKHSSSNSKKYLPYQHHKTYQLNDKLQASYSESRPTVVKLDGTRLNDDTLIKQHFDKDLIVDDNLQGNNEDSGFIIVGVKSDDDDDNQTGDYDDDIQDPNNNGHLQGTDNDNNRNSFSNNPDEDDSVPESDNKNNINDKDLLAIVQQLRNSAAVVASETVGGNSNEVTNENVTSYDDDNGDNNDDSNSTITTRHPNHNYNPPPTQPSSETSSELEVGLKRDNLPVINPIFDSVRPGRTMSIRTSVKSSTSVEETDIDNNNNNNDQDSSATSNRYNRQLHLVDKDIDDDEMFPDSDLYIESEGDLAASASRNVKSVAIIVTPPPHYVKIKNKYKKAVTPLSSLTSTTTPLPALEEEVDIVKEVPMKDRSSINENAFSESSNTTITTTPSSSLGIISNSNNNNNSNNDDKPDDEDEEDSILKMISEISNTGRGKLATTTASPSSSPSPASSESGSVKRPRLYPVYRGKPSS